MNIASAVHDYRIGLQHSLRQMWRTSRAFAAVAVGFALLQVAFACWLALGEPLPGAAFPEGIIARALLVAVVSLIMLPTLGGGADEDVSAFAAVRAGRAFRAGAHAASIVTDLGAAIIAPMVVVMAAASGGRQGLLAGLGIAVAGIGLGQAMGAAAARVAEHLGNTLTLILASFGLALLLRGGTSLDAAAALVTLSNHATVALVMSVLLSVFGLTTAGALTNTTSLAVRRARSRALPENPLLATITAVARNAGRSTIARNAVMSVALIPAIGYASGRLPDATVGIVVISTVAVIIGANGFGYDGGAPVWLLTRTDSRVLIIARYVTAFGWTALAAGVFSAVGAAVGSAPSAETWQRMLIVIVGAAAAGLVPSSRRPIAVDMDMRRAEPAPPVSAMGVLVRVLVIAGMSVVVPTALAVLLVVAYVALAALRALSAMRDPVALTSLA